VQQKSAATAPTVIGQHRPPEGYDLPE